MNDLIDRQAAIEAIRASTSKYTGFMEMEMYTDDDAVEAIEGLPSIQPERKTGEWIIRDNPGTGWYRVTCSECGTDVTSVIPVIGFFPNAKAIWNFCPECGSYNGGEYIPEHREKNG